MTEHRADDAFPMNTQRVLQHTVLADRVSTHQILIGLIVLSVLVRVAAAILLGDQAFPISGAADQYAYDNLAQRVLNGKGFSFATEWYPFTHADEPTAHWSFLYSLYLSAVYLLFGHHPLMARLIQVLLSSLNIWLIYRIATRLFDARVGLVAAALTTVYAYFIFYNATLMTQTFYILALLGAVDVALELVRNPKRRYWFLLGVCLGVGALFRQTLLLFAPLLLAWVAWMLGRRTRWRDVFLSTVVAALFILPWTLRNYAVYSDFLLLNSNGGYWLYASNHPNQGTNFDPDYVAPLPENLKNLKEPAIDRALYRQALEFIVNDPRRFVLLSINRIQDYFWLLPSDQSSFTSNLARLGSYTLYFPFMLLGLFLSRTHWRACLVLYLYILFEATLHITSWAAPRYRLPSDALMMVFAGLAVISLVRQFGTWKGGWTRLVEPLSSPNP